MSPEQSLNDPLQQQQPSEFVDEYALPDELVVLRSKMLAHTPLAPLRWDRLTTGAVEIIRALIEIHGDKALIERALKTTRADQTPVFVQFYLQTWQAMPEPGQRLAVVDSERCGKRGHELEPARNCRWCHAESKAASA